MEEAQGHVEGGAAPHLLGEEAGGQVGGGMGDAEQVVAAHARGDEALVRVPEGGVGEEQGLLVHQPLGQALGAPLR